MLVGLDDQTTLGEVADNTILILGVGPELSTEGHRLGVYARGLVGLAANVQSRSNSALEEKTTWATALGGGLGLRLALSSRVDLELGADLMKVGELDFARTVTSSLALMDDPTILRVRAGVRAAVR